MLVAEAQTSGRGRLDRSWESPVGAGLLFSVLIRPTASPATWGWLPLLTGLAVRQAVADVGGLDAGLKWPNDLLARESGRKLCGILVQSVFEPAPAAVIGVGLNISTTRGELPLDTAGSLLTETRAAPDRAVVLLAILDELGTRLAAWSAADGDAETSGLLAEYRARSVTIGTQVRVHLADGFFDGRAVDIDSAGRLSVATDEGVRQVSAGDVQHLRPTG